MFDWLKKYICSRDEKFYSDILNDSTLAIFVLDKRDKRIVYINDMCKSLFGILTQKGLYKKIIKNNNIEPVNFFDYAIENLKIKNKVDGKCLFTLHKGKNLRIRFVFSNSKFDKNLICVNATDITMSFSRHEREIAEMVNSAQLKAINDFAKTFAHNFGNKFSPIMYAIGKLLKLKIPEAPELTHDYIEKYKKISKRYEPIIVNGMHGLQSLANSVKNASKDYYIRKNELFNAHEYLNDLVQTYKDLEDNKEEVMDQVDIVKNFKEFDFMLYGMSERFEDAVTNLITNAIRFSHENPEDEMPRVEVSTDIIKNIEVNEHNSEKREVEYYSIKVTDNGPGIPKDVGNRVFEMGMTTKNVTDGAGVGLAISKRDISLFGGTISFECSYSSPYKTTFKILIPKEHNIEAHEEKQHEETNINIMVDVLVLDNNPDDLKALKSSLGMQGITCLGASNINAALRFARVSSAKVIVINPNLNINNIKGIDFLRQIETEKKYNDPKLFIFTDKGKDNEDVRDIIDEFGGIVVKRTKKYYLIKSIDQFLKGMDR
jgi:nitrogen-specific signal transduction histidine kinase/CheY-like chemotaxis protein